MENHPNSNGCCSNRLRASDALSEPQPLTLEEAEQALLLVSSEPLSESEVRWFANRLRARCGTRWLGFRGRWLAAAAIVLAFIAGAGAVQIAEGWLRRPTQVIFGNARVFTLDKKDSDNFIGTEDVEAIQSIADMLMNMGHRRGEYRLVSSKKAKLPITRGSVICVGGPTANSATKYYLERLNGFRDHTDDRPLTHGFRFATREGPPEHRWSVVSQSGIYGLEDLGTHEICPTDNDGTDCALIVMGKDPQFDVTVTIVAGYGGKGTLQVAEELVRDDSTLRQSIENIFRESSYVEAVVTVPPNGPSSFFKFRNAANPRGRLATMQKP